MSGQQRWGQGLAGPVRKRPVVSLTVGGMLAGFGLGLVIGWVKSKAQR